MDIGRAQVVVAVPMVVAMVMLVPMGVIVVMVMPMVMMIVAREKKVELMRRNE